MFCCSGKQKAGGMKNKFNYVSEDAVIGLTIVGLIGGATLGLMALNESDIRSQQASTESIASSSKEPADCLELD